MRMRKTTCTSPRRLLFPATLCLLGLCLLGFCACVSNDPSHETEAPGGTGIPSETPAASSDPVATDPETNAETATNAETEPQSKTEPPTETEEPVTDVMIGETLDAPYAADFTVAKVFSNDMVVQRGEHIRIWGWADESENGHKVSGEFMGMFAEALIRDGQWELTFGARLSENTEAGHDMRLYTDKKEVVFKDVLVGDVYMVIGQSNVAYPVAAHLAAWNTPDKGGASTLDYDLPIRLHYNSLGQTKGYPKRGTAETVSDLMNGSTWKKPTYAGIQNFSALGYYFAVQLLQENGGQVPIGIIEIDGNGQPIGAFMPNEAAKATGSDTWSDAKGYFTTTGCNGDAARYMYNHYMYPFERYAIAGVIWYQGESDFETANAMSFPGKLTALMTHMRTTHNLVNRSFPVFLVEFPSIYRHSSVSVVPSGQSWAFMDIGFVRGMLGSVPQLLPDSYLVVSCDLWGDRTYWNSLHPNCKYEQAGRAAKLAASLSDEVCTLPEATGPILVSIERSEDGKSMVLTYDNVGDGLTTCDGGVDVKGFRIIRYDRTGAYRLGKPSSAVITAPNQITVTAASSFYGVAYNAVSDFYYGEDLNLCNSYGCPAGATAMAVPKG